MSDNDDLRRVLIHWVAESPTARGQELEHWLAEHHHSSLSPFLWLNDVTVSRLDLLAAVIALVPSYTGET